MNRLVSIEDFEENARKKLSKVAFEFFYSGALQERTVKWNVTSYAKYRIRPKYMRKIPNRKMSTTILGKEISNPIGVSPTACQKIAHPDGEVATARGAGAADSIFILSSHSNTPLEEVARMASNTRKWLQFYIFGNNDMTIDLVKSAEKAGFEALVLTVDFNLLGLRYISYRNNFELPSNLSFPILDKYRELKMIDGYQDFSEPVTDWSFITWLKTITHLPIIAKGVLTAEDAILAINAGASGILVSNHGGRQLDSLPATIEVLPEIVKAVGDKTEVYMDCGIRSGLDAFKALSMGAKMVFVGRVPVWGLAHDGEKGVTQVLNILKNELDNAMGIAGCESLESITPDMVVHESFYSRL